MTIVEKISKYQKLKKELDTTKNILNKLNAKPVCVKDYAKDYKTGYPVIKNIEGFDELTDYKIQKYTEKKDKLKVQVKAELEKLELFINNIKSDYIKKIFKYRYIAGMSFSQIATLMDKDEYAVKQSHWKFLKKCKKNKEI